MQRLSDPYRLLGVGRDATAVEIKAAHRRLAKRLHPDRAQGDPDAFLAVQDAYELLSDPLRRREWDRRHAPGPVPAGESPRAARDAREGRGARDAGDARGAREGRDPERPGRPASPRAGATRPAPARPATGSAAGAGASGEAREGPGRQPRTARPPGPSAAPDPDPFSRSSGAAWSSASRAFFRRASADMPSGAANPNTPRWTTPLGATPPPRYASSRAPASASSGDTARTPAGAPQRPADASSQASPPSPLDPAASDVRGAVPPTTADPAWPTLIQRAETGLLAALPLVAFGALAAFDQFG
ncbi:MAG: DnaJ domain-containing protein, partial [Candidatus Limnocylindrales bacterium]